MDYKEKYEKLKEYLINLTPYCDNCENNENTDRCDDCHRKYFNWRFSTKILKRFE
jgi:hypothetical protein